MKSVDGDKLPYGVYELVDSARLPKELFPVESEPTFEKVEEAERIRVLSTYIAQRLEHQLTIATKEERVDIVNRALQSIDPADAINWSAHDDKDRGSFQQLVALAEHKTKLARPSTPLSDVSLLTNSPKEPSLKSEIAKELASADRVDLICSFLKVSGINLIERALEALRRRGVPLRIVTTTYMGATDAKAVQKLHDLGAEIKISYANQSTRLHAKAWLFERDSGFSTGYVGSSNLSAAAMTDGLEWNVRLSSVTTPGALAQFRASFELYWNDPQFVTYSPEQFDELDGALSRARSEGGQVRTLEAINTTFLDVYPRPHQASMLDHLAAERSRGHHRNLVVSATGTGKTILSALDFRNLTEQLEEPRLLFVAHRREILYQAREAFRATLRKNRLGEILGDGERPEEWHHVFATIQSLSCGAINHLPRDHFDVVIIDEFHHADARTYRDLINFVQPQELVGLTATPERGDGTNVADEFFDGRIASELRLWDALDADLLVPFHYFGIDDGTDLSALELRQGNYESSELDRIYIDREETAQRRLRVIFEELERKVADPRSMKALGFCSSKRHAEYMAEAFNRANIPAEVLLGESDTSMRSNAVDRLLSDSDPLAIIFTVDIFNEGIDIPEVDTILMLRPTQSPTLFQQQLGRGLRRAPKKAVLTVLDFVGNQSKLFRFDRKYTVFGRGGRLTEKMVEEGFADVPAGCSIQLDQIAQGLILARLKDALQVPTRKLVPEVGAFLRQQHTGTPAVSQLPAFLAETGRGLEHIYRFTADVQIGNSKAKRTWTSLVAASGVESHLTNLFSDERFVEIQNRIIALTSVNDPGRVNGYRELLRGKSVEADLSDVERRLAWMLAYSFWTNGKFAGATEKFTLDEALTVLRQYPAVADELEQVWELVADADRQVFAPAHGLEGRSPLVTHGYYSREELFAGLGAHEKNGRPPSSVVEGVLESDALDAVALLVTLEKTEKHFSPQTMYKDYAVATDMFAWDSQGSTSPESSRGQMLQGIGPDVKMPLLFVRRTKTGGPIPGATEPYMFLGPVKYLHHEGSQPMHITWELETDMPADVFNIAKAAG